MSTSKSSSADKRQRPARKVPRRHEDSAEKKAIATYDGGEFPVLLRMPDVTVAELSVTSTPADDESIEDYTETESSVQNASSPPHHKKHHRERRRSKSESSSEGSRLTAFASTQFWRSLAPKIAVGGMLLSVLAICGVMFMGPRNSDMTSELNKPDWTNHTAANPRHDMHSHEVTNATGSETSVLSKQDAVSPHTVAPRVPGPMIDREPSQDSQIQPYEPSEKTQSGPSFQSDPSRSFDVPNSYPKAPATGNGEPTPAAPDANGPFHAQGWPDDADVGGAAEGNAQDAAYDPGVQLNAAGNNAAPQLRTSYRQQRMPTQTSDPNRKLDMPNSYPRGSLSIPNAGLPTPGNGASAAANPPSDGAYRSGTRLDGTIEIIHPNRTSYR